MANNLVLVVKVLGQMAKDLARRLLGARFAFDRVPEQ